MEKAIKEHADFLNSKPYKKAFILVGLFENPDIDSNGYEKEYRHALVVLDEEKRLYAISAASCETLTGEEPDGYYSEGKGGSLMRVDDFMLKPNEFKKEGNNGRTNFADKYKARAKSRETS